MLKNKLIIKNVLGVLSLLFVLSCSNENDRTYECQEIKMVVSDNDTNIADYDSNYFPKDTTFESIFIRVSPGSGLNQIEVYSKDTTYLQISSLLKDTSCYIEKKDFNNDKYIYFKLNDSTCFKTIPDFHLPRMMPILYSDSTGLHMGLLSSRARNILLL